MERTLYLVNAPGESVSEETACCFVRQLIKDLKENTPPKIKWQRDSQAGWGTFFTKGLSGDSYIQLKRQRGQKHTTVCLSYSKAEKFVYNLLEFDGSPAEPTSLAHLYKWVNAAVKHNDIYGDSASRDDGKHLSVADMDDHCLKIIDVFRSLTAAQIEERLMKCKEPSVLSAGISDDSPEYRRRCKMITSLVKFIQSARIKESSLLVEGLSLINADGKICGNIVTDPVAKWVNAHIIIQEAKYAELTPDEIRLKVASDIIANLLLDM